MKEAAVQVIFEDRKNNIRHEMEGDYAGAMLHDMNDGSLACIFAGDVSKKEIIVAMAQFVNNIIKAITDEEDEQQILGILFVKSLGRTMAGEKTEPEIRIDGWKEETE